VGAAYLLGDVVLAVHRGDADTIAACGGKARRDGTRRHRRDDRPGGLQAFVTRHPVAYPLAAVRAGSIAAYTGRVLGVGIRPLAFLIRPDGSLAKRFFGKITAAEVTAIVGSVRR